MFSGPPKAKRAAQLLHAQEPTNEPRAKLKPIYRFVVPANVPKPKIPQPSPMLTDGNTSTDEVINQMIGNDFQSTTPLSLASNNLNGKKSNKKNK